MIIKLTDIKLSYYKQQHRYISHYWKTASFKSQSTTRHTHRSLKWALFRYSQVITLPELFRTSH